MKLNMKWLYVFVFVAGLPLAAKAEMLSDEEMIKSMREYHGRMVRMIDGYMSDRARIPADYRASADKDFLKKAKAEKMVTTKPAAPKPAAEKKK